MNFFLSAVVLVVASTIVNVHAVSENYVIEAVLNDGRLLPHGEMCTVAEWNSIVKAANDALPDRRRRFLKRSNPDHSKPHRGWCSGGCRSKPKHCIYVGVGCPMMSSRRQMQQSEADSFTLNPVETVLVDSLGDGAAPSTNILGEVVDSHCSMAISNINAALDAVEPSLSSDCQAVLNSARNFTCYDVVETEAAPVAPLCEVKGFALWNAASDTLAVPEFTNGSSFCRKAFPFSIQAETDECVERVQFDLVGTNGYHKDQTEMAFPFFSSGNKGPSIFETKVKAGTYTLSAYPNNDMSLTKTLTFTVKDC